MASQYLVTSQGIIQSWRHSTYDITFQLYTNHHHFKFWRTVCSVLVCHYHHVVIIYYPQKTTYG